MRALTLATIAAATLMSTPVLAQSVGDVIWPRPNYDSGSGISEINGRTANLVATTPSRIERSRREMNYGRESNWASNPTPTQVRASAERALQRGGFHCTIAEHDMVAQLRDGTPVVEVACQENGGLVIADSNPIQATDCFDLASGDGDVAPCRLAKNVALVSGARQ